MTAPNKNEPPQHDYSYSTVAGVQVLTGTSTCQTGSSCAGTSDEVKTTVAYDSNLNPTSVSSGAGDGSLTATTAATYDALGNLITVDGPLSGSSDTTTFRYDAARRRTGSISADPDGAGSLKRRAVRTTYNADGQATVTETGTVTGTSDTDWAAFVSLQQVTATYDGNAYKTKDVLTASSTTYGVTQYSYDADGRIDCAATRMNASAWGSLPSSACTAQTAGSYGPDRIVKTTYDAVGRVTKVQTAYGITGVQADEATATFTDNGKTATATDAEGNKTSYTYDGFDRRRRRSARRAAPLAPARPARYSASQSDIGISRRPSPLRDRAAGLCPGCGETKQPTGEPTWREHPRSNSSGRSRPRPRRSSGRPDARPS